MLDTTENGFGVGKVGQARKTEISPNHQVRANIVPTIPFHGTLQPRWWLIELSPRLVRGLSGRVVCFDQDASAEIQASFPNQEIQAPISADLLVEWRR